MTAFWISAAFVAGMLFWHYAGRKMLTMTLRRNNDMTRDILSALSITALRKLQRSVDAEIEKRRHELQEPAA